MQNASTTSTLASALPVALLAGILLVVLVVYVIKPMLFDDDTQRPQAGGQQQQQTNAESRPDGSPSSGAVGTAYGLCSKYARDPSKLKAEEVKLMEELQGYALKFTNHMKTHPKYGKDKRVMDMVAAWNGVVLMAKGPSAMFVRPAGCIVIPNYGEGDLVRSWDRLTVLHELAHAAMPQKNNPHDGTWRSVYHWFAEVASSELGWDLSPSCFHCKDYGICSTKQCRKCNWTHYNSACKTAK